MPERDLSLSEKIAVDDHERVAQASGLDANKLEIGAVALRVIGQTGSPDLLAEISGYAGVDVSHSDLIAASTLAARLSELEKGVANAARQSVDTINQHGLPS